MNSSNRAAAYLEQTSLGLESPRGTSQCVGLPHDGQNVTLLPPLLVLVVELSVLLAVSPLGRCFGAALARAHRILGVRGWDGRGALALVEAASLSRGCKRAKEHLPFTAAATIGSTDAVIH